MKICFDIDGCTMTQGSPENNYTDSSPIPEMILVVNELYDNGHEIYFFTARHFKHFLFTEKTLKDAGYKYHGLIMNKPAADIYIDDRAFKLNNYQQKEELLLAIKELKHV